MAAAAIGRNSASHSLAFRHRQELAIVPRPNLTASKFVRFSILILLLITGCHALPTTHSLLPRSLELPQKREIVRGQLVIHSDFHLPRRHRLLGELQSRRDDVSQLLNIPVSDEPIHIYLFANEASFTDYMQRKHPLFPNRRAFFVKNDTSLMVFAWWGNRVAEDLRHEVTHGYLHSVINDLPLWLDEGIAEYFETPRVNRGFNSPHFHLLIEKYDSGQWQPDLERLESLRKAGALTLMDYAESWLWVHYLLHHEVETAGLLQHHIEQVRLDPAAAKSLHQLLTESDRDATELLSHLEYLRKTVKP
ncbi:DUF1570 domain-containing protein [Mariniblastus fucicola]|uniref:DUF1570 domain-containing protein n=1 Tax=Mariniblastus fucicola TaxID=980251 RepID=A0A5B9P325_9BACT|nr:DUF1570 domain-containing protein [Mariniblastus fucicola]QEG20937.1 hypothetical protein MFFC18_07880 [Mariniblastus fucicola]